MISICKGTCIARKYQLEAPLARGGMGSIWTARHLPLDVLVAIKFIDPDLATPERRGRFTTTAWRTRRLTSRWSSSRERTSAPGYSARGGSRGDAATVAIHVGRALRRIHDAGIVHCDLKPSNLFIVHGDDDEELIKVIDFGVSKARCAGCAAEEASPGMLIGSPHYMSPEQASRSRDIDHRSDLWSLAVILYRAITGRLPFPGDDMNDVLVKICSGRLPLPSEVTPDLGAPVDRFFVKALARDPAQRFQSAREMAAAFAGMASALPPLPAVIEGRIAQRAELLEVATTIEPSAIEIRRVVCPEGARRCVSLQ